MHLQLRQLLPMPHGPVHLQMYAHFPINGASLAQRR